MSQQNVEIVQAFFEAWNAGDMVALRELYDPDAIVRSVEGWPEPGPYVGREAILRQWKHQRETWDNTDTLEPISEFIEVANQVVVRMMWRGAGRGPESIMELTSVTTLRKGRIFYGEFFWDHAEALEAVGLQEPAVSQENMELVRSVIASWERGDYSSAGWAHPDIEFVIADGPAPGHWTGLRGMAEGWRDVLSAWEEFHGEAAEDYRDLGGGRVLVLNRFGGRGKVSGLEVGQVGVRAATLIHVRDGKVTKLVLYWDRERALTELGLSDQDAHADSA